MSVRRKLRRFCRRFAIVVGLIAGVVAGYNFALILPSLPLAGAARPADSDWTFATGVLWLVVVLIGVGAGWLATRALGWAVVALYDRVNVPAATLNERGVRFRDGNGMDPDPARALELFRKAAERGYYAAQFNLGCMYANGRGVERDPVEAYAWWDIAADAGNEDARRARDLLASTLPSEELERAAARARELYVRHRLHERM